MRGCWMAGAAAILLLTGCGQTAGQPLQSDFTLQVEFQTGADKATAEIKRSGGCIRVAYTSPTPLEGMVYTFDGETATLTYRELQAEADSALLQASSAGMLATALEDAIPKGGRTVNGITQNGGYLLSCDADGYPQKLDIDSKDLHCVFTRPAE